MILSITNLLFIYKNYQNNLLFLQQEIYRYGTFLKTSISHQQKVNIDNERLIISKNGPNFLNCPVPNRTGTKFLP